MKRNSHMKLLMILTIKLGLLLMPIVALGQIVTPHVCSMSKKELSAVRGLTLGMESEKFTALLPRTIWLSDDRFYAVPPEGDQFSGVRRISGGFFDKKLYTFDIVYETDVEWTDVGEFVANLNQNLHLPANSVWRTNSRGGLLECRDFTIRAWISPVSISFEDDEASSALRARERQTEETKRKTFKP